MVFSEGVLCYVDDDQKALAEMVRVARPGGRLIVAVPNVLNLLHPLYKCLVGAKFEYGRERSYSPTGLRRRAVELGLSQIELRGFHPAYAIVRLGGPLRRLGELVDKVIVRNVDWMTCGQFSDLFGFYIVLIGRKPG